MADKIIRVTLETNAPGYSAGMKEAASSTTKAGDAMGKTEKQSTALAKSGLSLKGIMQEAAGTFVGFVGAQAIVGGAVAVIRTLTDSIIGFDDQMTQSLAIMGNVSAGTRRELELAARQTAVDYNAAIKDTAGSYYFLASAGYDAQTSIKALPQVTAFAKAGMLGLEQATSFAADAQAAMGLKTGNASEDVANLTRITDVLTQANNKANGSVEDFSEALTTKAAASARLAGISLEETVGVLEAFAAQGLKGRRAGEAFSIVLRDLQNESVENAEAFEAMGVQVYNADGSMRHIYEIIGQVEEALRGQSVAQQNATLSTMGFTAESMAYFKTLLGTSDAIRDFTAANYEAGGATQEVAQKQMGSMIERLKHIKAEAIELGIKGFDYLKMSVEFLGEAFGPALGNIAEILGDIWDNLEPVVELFGKLVGASVIASLLGLAEALELVSGFVADNEEAVQLLAIALTAYAIASTARWISQLTTIPAMLLYAGDAMKGMGEKAKAFAAIEGVGVKLAAAGDAARSMLSKASSALANLAAPATFVVIAAAIDGFIHRADAGKKSAEDFFATLGDFDSSSADNVTNSVGRMAQRLSELDKNTFKKATLGDYAAAWADIVIPIQDVEHSLSDTGAEMDSIKAKIEEQQASHKLWMDAAYDTTQALQELGEELTGTDVVSWMKKLELDPMTMSVEEMAKAIKAANDQAEFGTPKTEALAESFGTVADETSSATDKLKAYKEAMDAAIGVVISSFDANTKYAQAQHDLAVSLFENGKTLDAYTEAGRNNRDALSGAAKAALDHAEAVATETGSIEEGNAVLNNHVLQLYDVMRQLGLTDEEAKDYLETLGLTPENLQTLVQLNGAEAAKAGIKGVQDGLDLVKRGAHGNVTVDVSNAIRELTKLYNYVAATLGIVGEFSTAAARAADPSNPANRSSSADGNIYRAYAAGGVEHHVAQIDGRGMTRIWNEPETGGEAYIPLGYSKRGRSEAILAAVAEMFGKQVVPMAHGGIIGSVVSGAGAGGNVNVQLGPVHVEVYTQSTVDRAQLTEAVRGAVGGALDSFASEMSTERRARRVSA